MLRECRPSLRKSASLRLVETLHNSRQVLNRLNYFLGKFYDLRNREGTPSSRSNCMSVKDAAIPYQLGVAAGSARSTCAIVATTTFPRPSGRLTSTISNTIGTPTSNGLGHRKYTPVELMFRVTSVTGNSSRTRFTLRSRSGSFSVARGYSRCSGCTPNTCVGTRTKRRGCVSRRSGSTCSAGACTGIAMGRVAGVGIAARVVAVAASLFKTNKLARFVALISPPEMLLRRRRPWPNGTDFSNCPDYPMLRSGALKCH
jgi:hypothetical protein